MGAGPLLVFSSEMLGILFRVGMILFVTGSTLPMHFRFARDCFFSLSQKDIDSFPVYCEFDTCQNFVQKHMTNLDRALTFANAIYCLTILKASIQLVKVV